MAWLFQHRVLPPLTPVSARPPRPLLARRRAVVGGARLVGGLGGLGGWLLAAAMTVGAGGCGEPAAAVAESMQSRVVSGSFDVGKIDPYRRNGVYTRYGESHGVYLVSAHEMLVAIAAQCTNPAHRPSAVRYDEVAAVFRCGVCGEKFTRDGLHIGPDDVVPSLRRCRIRSSGQIYDPDTTLIVDPGKQFAQEDQEWSKHTSYFPLAEITRSRDEQEARRALDARTAEQPPMRWSR